MSIKKGSESKLKKTIAKEGVDDLEKKVMHFEWHSLQC